jgi:folate-dependent phosphoribosylglycinamide formyltransferase PurN
MKNTHSKLKNIILMIGDGLRHEYFFRQLNFRHQIAAVFILSSNYPKLTAKTKEENDAWNWFFERRVEFEKDSLTPALELKPQNKPDIINVECSKLNSPETLSLINKYSPGFIAVFGIGILKEEILSYGPDSIYNLHVGLPEFYRGSSCNFWPIYNRDFKNLGATVHKVEKGVDTGKIAEKKAITLKSDDNEQSLMWKTLKVGTQLMDETLQKWKRDALHLKVQKKIGKQYKMNEFNPAAILSVKLMVESGELKSELESTLSKKP